MEKEIEFLQVAEIQATDITKATEVVNKIAASIKSVVDGNENGTCKQIMLNMGFRAYYKILYKYNLQDSHFDEVLNENPAFEMLYAILLSEREKHLETSLIKEICLNALVLNNDNSSLLILKTLNLLFRKHPTLDADISLLQVYFCLQYNEVGMREEALLLFNHCCKHKERAQKYFQYIIEHYPWTNRNKFYMLSCILNTHNLEEFLEITFHDPKDFFAGLRLSLSYKYLLPASQYLVKALSKQESQHLLEIIATILTTGSFKEIRNLYAQWFSRIIQKDALFQLLQEKLEVRNALLNFSMLKLSNEAYRFILIFFIYSRQIMSASKLHFFKISTELITNCFEFDNETQFLIYKFVAENMCFFALEDCLEFLYTFIKNHINVENAQMRNNILGKIPTIINYISKTFFKVQKLSEGRSTSLDISIKTFFSHLHQTILVDIGNKIYQPKIFALKLLDILLKSLYQQNLEKNAKNCNLAQNKHLGSLLVSHNVFNAAEITKQLVKALYDPQGFNDALDLIVELLQKLESIESQHMIDMCQKCSQSFDIDECALSMYYAKVALKGNIGYEKSGSVLYKHAIEMLRREIPSFKEDPLFNCKQRSHLFGYVETVNEILSILERSNNTDNDDFNYSELLNILEQIENMILEMLNSSEEQVYSASFQDMDKSLEILVQQSKFETANHEECRKFLLMSFWLTLKACCDVATTLGSHLAFKYQKYKLHTEKDLKSNTVQKTDYLRDLRRCLNLNTYVLTRCRHKGAIEAAGLSIGKLTKNLTSYKQLHSSEINELLWNGLSVLFDNGKSVSTTRRGAGYSIMFLHFIKNEYQPGRPLLKRAMTNIFEILACESLPQAAQKSNCDRMEALVLHYLCVLVKDAEIRNVIFSYYNEIMLAAIAKIDDSEWTVCNAALQLFGALVPKVVGQRQATEFEEPQDWEPAQVTYLEILHNMPKTFNYILNYCKDQANKSSSTRSIILFLGFLSKIEHLPQDTQQNEEIIFRLRELMWSLLQHSCEKVRKLAAACFVRAHDFRCQLPQILSLISDLIFKIQNENFFEGLVFVMCEGFAKMQNEALHTVPSHELDVFYESFRENLIKNSKLDKKFKYYTQAKLLDMFSIVGISNFHSCLIRELSNSVNLKVSKTKLTIGHDEWCRNLEKFT